MKLLNSGADLAGNMGRLRGVTRSEVRKHRARDDCWSVLLAKLSSIITLIIVCYRMIYDKMVYNVTPYFKFHPGNN
jgi:cytochrome b involved in lipid metabolism